MYTGSSNRIDWELPYQLTHQQKEDKQLRVICKSVSAKDGSNLLMYRFIYIPSGLWFHVFVALTAYKSPILSLLKFKSSSFVTAL